MKYRDQTTAAAFALSAVRDACMATLVAGTLMCLTTQTVDPNTWQRMRSDFISKLGLN